ncbi:hypothetical protein [Prauserella marina]|uniref:hypothetical protein n=1 Tax=Prauserella marina TaxID=530584 RepID=UPI001472C3E4|nr:hypothetical protein [Prauserella marina]
MSRTSTHTQTGTPLVSPVLFSHPDARPAVTEAFRADLHRTRQVRFSAATATPSGRHR